MGHARKVLTGVALAAASLAATASAASPEAPLGRAADVPFGVHVAPQARAAFATNALPYNTGPVMRSNRTHVIFWNPGNKGLAYDPGYQSAVTTFLSNVAADSQKETNPYSVISQYTDSTGGRASYDSTFAGAVSDSDNAPANGCTLPAGTGPTLPDGTPWPVCLTQAQLETEIQHVVTTQGLPTGLGDMYFLVTPDGFGSCVAAGPTNCSLGGNVSSGFCGYHTFIGPKSAPILYANIPYNDDPPHCGATGPHPNGTADPSIGTISHEQNETITDPVLDAWHDSSNMEVADLCGGFFGPALGGSSGATAYNAVIGSGHYVLPEEWSNDDAAGSTDPKVGCQPREEALPMSISMPSSILPGSQAAISGTATDPDGMIVSYGWDFGDGTPTAAGPSVSHTYPATGAYPVTLTVTDITGLQQSLTKTLAVDHPPVPHVRVSTAHPVEFIRTAFDATGSTDQDGTISQYHWDFGDGFTATGARPTHIFADRGTFTVTVTVTDNLGVFASASARVTVAPFPRIKATVKGRALKLSVNGPGTLTLGSAHKRVKRAGAVTITVPLSAAQLRTLARRHVLKLKLKVTFRPRVGPTVTKTFKVTLHG